MKTTKTQVANELAEAYERGQRDRQRGKTGQYASPYPLFSPLDVVYSDGYWGRSYPEGFDASK